MRNDIKAGWAFPSGPNDTTGMTLRDYLAIRAPLIFDVPEMVSTDENADQLAQILDVIVRWNYAYADAMLAERDK